MTQIVHEVVCGYGRCSEQVGTSESFNALAFLLSDLGWSEVKMPDGSSEFFCPQHRPVENDAKTTYSAMCINCNYDWGGEEFTEDDFPYIRSDHSRSCFNDSHWQCRSTDVKFHTTAAPKIDPEKHKEWARLAEEANAHEMYVAMLIQQDQWRRTEDELMAKRSWLVRTILKIRNTLK